MALIHMGIPSHRTTCCQLIEPALDYSCVRLTRLLHLLAAYFEAEVPHVDALTSMTQCTVELAQSVEHVNNFTGMPKMSTTKVFEDK